MITNILLSLILIVLIKISNVLSLDFHKKYDNIVKKKSIWEFGLRKKTHWDKVKEDLEKLTKE